jgi:hypothetical protein
MYIYEPTLEAAVTIVLFWPLAWLRLLFGPKKYGNM